MATIQGSPSESGYSKDTTVANARVDREYADKFVRSGAIGNIFQREVSSWRGWLGSKLSNWRGAYIPIATTDEGGKKVQAFVAVSSLGKLGFQPEEIASLQKMWVSQSELQFQQLWHQKLDELDQAIPSVLHGRHEDIAAMSNDALLVMHQRLAYISHLLAEFDAQFLPELREEVAVRHELVLDALAPHYISHLPGLKITEPSFRSGAGQYLNAFTECDMVQELFGDNKERYSEVFAARQKLLDGLAMGIALRFTRMENPAGTLRAELQIFRMDERGLGSLTVTWLRDKILELAGDAHVEGARSTGVDDEIEVLCKTLAEPQKLTAKHLALEIIHANKIVEGNPDSELKVARMPALQNWNARLLYWAEKFALVDTLLKREGLAISFHRGGDSKKKVWPNGGVVTANDIAVMTAIRSADTLPQLFEGYASLGPAEDILFELRHIDMSWLKILVTKVMTGKMSLSDFDEAAAIITKYDIESFPKHLRQEAQDLIEGNRELIITTRARFF